MASIRQRAGKWQARVIRKGYPPETKGFDTCAQAQRWAREVGGAIDRCAHRDDGATSAATKRGGKDPALRIGAL